MSPPSKTFLPGPTPLADEVPQRSVRPAFKEGCRSLIENPDGDACQHGPEAQAKTE
jgi:hypothetical protein